MATTLADLPHAQIRADRDRTWTATLVTALHGASEGERAEIARSLLALGDPRAAAGLTAILVSPSGTPALRQLASDLVLRLVPPPPDDVLRGWWQRGDRLLRRHALRAMGPQHAELLEVAGDPRHPFLADAIGRMTEGFEAPAHQAMKIAALQHAEVAVRRAAARALSTDVPAAAEGALVGALLDDDPEVASIARVALSQYGSRRALRALAVIAPRPGADTAPIDLPAAFARALRDVPPAGRARLEAWMASIADLLPDGDEGEDAADGDDAADGGDDDVLAAGSTDGTHGNGASARSEAPAPPRRSRPGTDEVLAMLAAADGPWAEIHRHLQELRPEQIAPDARDAIALRAATHDDAAVRAQAAGWMAAWGDEPRLRALLADPSPDVRAHAVTAYAELPRGPDSPAIAARMRAHLEQPDTVGAHALETLASYLAHAPADEAFATLAAVARGDRREALRDHAIQALVASDARALVQPLLAELTEPPRVTWAVHVRLVEAAIALGLPVPDAPLLRDADSLDVQVALAWLDAARAA